MTVIEFAMALPNPTNRRDHWSVRADRNALQRRTTRWMLKGNAVEPTVPAGQCLVVKLTRIARQTMDGDGNTIAFKAVRDEVAAYFGLDDADPRLRFEYAQAKGTPAAVRIELSTEPLVERATVTVKPLATTPREWAKAGRLSSGVVRNRT